MQREFEKVIRNLVRELRIPKSQETYDQTSENTVSVSHGQSDNANSIIQDIENNVPGAVPTISHHVSLMNGHLKNFRKDYVNHNHNITKPPISIGTTKRNTNGDLRNRQSKSFKDMLEEAER